MEFFCPNLGSLNLIYDVVFGGKDISFFLNDSVFFFCTDFQLYMCKKSCVRMKFGPGKMLLLEAADAKNDMLSLPELQIKMFETNRKPRPFGRGF